jgi:hypothetical protein
VNPEANRYHNAHRMKLHLLIALAAALFLSGTAHADPAAAPPPPGTTAQTPVPPPAPANASQTPPPAARKEDEPVNVSALQHVANFLSGRKRSADNASSLQAQVDTLTQNIAARDATIAQLQATITEQNGMLEQISAYLTESGLSDPAAVAANPASAFSTAVGTGVAAAVRTIGVPLANVPSPAAASGSGATSQLDEIREQMANTKDPLERGKLAAQAKKLRSAN